MARLLLLLSLVLGCLLAAASAADEQFVFDGFKGANLSFDGMATVTPEGLLMLTNGTSQLKGHAFYPAPLQFHRNGTAMRSFSTAFVIGIIGAYEDLSSHGMAFVVAKSANFTSALPGQFMGLVSSATNGNATNHLFAVEFDTILNSEFNDMSGNHVGIDVDGLNSVDADNAGYYDDATGGAFRNMSLVSRKAMQVWVDFDGQAMQVNVTMAPLEVSRPKKPLLSTTVNLSSVIDGDAYVGFSSATGILFCRHYVLGWSLRMDGAAPALNVSSLPALPVTFPKARSKTLEIVLPIASAVAAAAFAFLRRRRMYAEVNEDWEAAFGPHRFSYKDLFHATDGFSDGRLLGIGGFGRVYRGVLASSKTEVAVKKVAHGSRQGMREFVAGRQHRPPPPPQPRAAARLLPAQGRAAPGVRLHAQRQPRQAPLRPGQDGAELGAEVLRRQGRRVRPALPPRGLGAGGGAPGHQGQQRAARQGDERPAGRLRAGAAVRPWHRPAHHARRGHHGLHGAGAGAHGQGVQGVRRVRLRRLHAGGGVRAEARGAGRARQPPRAGGLGARPLARRLRHGHGGPAPGRRLPPARGEPGAQAGPAVLAPAAGGAPRHAADRPVPGRRRPAAGAVADVPGTQHARAHAGPGLRALHHVLPRDVDGSKHHI